MVKLPETAWNRVLEARPEGRVLAIAIRPHRRQDTIPVDSWTPGDGHDHAKLGDRAVTLIQREHLDLMASQIGRPVDFALTRRNLLVEGFNLAVLQGRRFRVGDLVLEGTEKCHPCARMRSTFGPDGYTAMYEHGGLCAKVIEFGEVRIGDSLTLVET